MTKTNPFTNLYKNMALTPLSISLIYVGAAIFWIIGSGYLMMLNADDFGLSRQVEIAKGLAFVLFTGTLLYGLLRKWHNKIVDTYTQLQATLDAVPDLLFEVDIFGKYYSVHSPHTDLLAAPKEVLLGKTIFEILPYKATIICLDALRQADSEGYSHGKQIELEINGEKKWFELSVSTKMASNLDEKRFVVLSRDITDRTVAHQALAETTQKLQELNEKLTIKVEEETTKRIEQERLLLQKSKMAMMGEMMSAIAHHWRQPLNSLGINVQDAYVAYTHGEIDTEYMNEFKTNSMSIIQGMSRTIDNFRNFFRPSNEKVDFSITDAINETIAIIKDQLTDNKIDMRCEESGKYTVCGYKNEVAQALLIIVSNAQDALLRNNIQAPFINISTIGTKQDTVIINIEDNAGGIPTEIIDRIFEPYYTTKHQSQGTGIGLFIARETFERHMDGRLSVINTEHGAKFSIELSLKNNTL
jgi:PAS domain S-box-containing protein